MATGNHEDVVLEAKKSKLKPPPMFKVILLNDDFTPMDFVIAVLQTFFSMNREQATKIMLKVHQEGIGVAGVYPFEVAETKAEKVSQLAREYEFPLLCTVEEE